MNEMLNWLDEFMPLLILALFVFILFVLLLYISLFVRFKKLKKRYDFFTGANRRPDHNLETQMIEHMQRVKEVEEKYQFVVENINDMKQGIRGSFQKVGVVRYNPFEEMGGNLSFAVALLDGNDNGFVLNGIHSRTGTFTYAKPIEAGVSAYVLCAEEIQAIEQAKKSCPDTICDKIEVEKKIKIYRVVVPVKKREREVVEEKQNIETVTSIGETVNSQEQNSTQDSKNPEEKLIVDTEPFIEAEVEPNKIDFEIMDQEDMLAPVEETVKEQEEENSEITALKEIVLGNILDKKED